MRRSVDAVMLVAERNTPHVLLIQVHHCCEPHDPGANDRCRLPCCCGIIYQTGTGCCGHGVGMGVAWSRASNPAAHALLVQVHGGFFRLPGGRLRPGEEGAPLPE